MLKVLTLHQPWASLVALGVKTIETRSWSTKYRGPLAIHAATKRTVGQVVREWKVFDAGLGPRTLQAEHYGTVERIALPLGAIVATCTLVDVVPIVADPENVRGPLAISTAHGSVHVLDSDSYQHDYPDQAPYGDFTPGRFAWLLADIEPVDPPVPFKGGQGLTKTWEPGDLVFDDE